MKKNSFYLLLKSLNAKSKMKIYLILVLSSVSSVMVIVLPLLISRIVALLDIKGNNITELIYLLGFMYVFLIASQKTIDSFVSYIQSNLRVECISSVSRIFFEKIYKKVGVFEPNSNTGDYTQSLNQATNDIYIMFNCVFVTVTPTLIQLIISITVVMGTGDFLVGSGFLLYSVLFVWLNITLSEKLIMKREVLMESGRKTYSLLTDSVKNIPIVKAFNSFDFFFDRFDGFLKEDIKLQKGYWNTNFICVGLSAILQLFFIVGMFFFSLVGVIEGRITLSHFILISSYIFLMSAPLEGLGQSFLMFIQSWKAFESFDFFSDSYRRDREEAGGKLFKHGDLILKDVVYEYENGGEIIGPLNAYIKKGSFVTITGTSGSGKSTLIKLIARQLDKKSGFITISDVDISELIEREFYENVVYISQDDYVFMESVLFNLKVANPDANDEDVLDALHKVEVFSNVLDVEEIKKIALADDGDNISGGQRQRLSLARLFLRNPFLILLDEVTSSVDITTEKIILKRIRDGFPNATILNISHRSSSLDFSDNVITVEKGAVVDSHSA